MNDYTYIILNYLYERWEHSVLSKQGSLKDIQISVKIEKLFPYYNSSSYYQQHLDIDNTCRYLQQADLIDIKYNDEDIYSISLNLDRRLIKKGYKLINRTYLNDYRRQTLQYLSSLNVNETWINEFIGIMIDKLNNYKSIQRYINIEDLQETKDIIQVLMTLQQEKEISYRKFSLKILRDSKRFEMIKHKVIHIIQDFYPQDFENEEDILSYFNIIKNPSFIYLSGHMTIQLNNQVIDLGKLNGPFSITSDNISNLEIIDIQDHNILTIENLTSFYDIEVNNALVIYLGGYHNSIRRELLLKIYNFNHHLHFYHFGDIDAGGFYIYLHLCHKTNIHFDRLLMDKQTLITYHQYTKVLTSNDRKRLKDLKQYINDDIIDYMLEYNCKLEQEIIEVNKDIFGKG